MNARSAAFPFAPAVRTTTELLSPLRWARPTNLVLGVLAVLLRKGKPTLNLRLDGTPGSYQVDKDLRRSRADGRVEPEWNYFVAGGTILK
jgi:hypothetical protein